VEGGVDSDSESTAGDGTVQVGGVIEIGAGLIDASDESGLTATRRRLTWVARLEGVLNGKAGGGCSASDVDSLLRIDGNSVNQSNSSPPSISE
jgi:hypothetical protein